MKRPRSSKSHSPKRQSHSQRSKWQKKMVLLSVNLAHKRLRERASFLSRRASRLAGEMSASLRSSSPTKRKWFVFIGVYLNLKLQIDLSPLLFRPCWRRTAARTSRLLIRIDRDAPFSPVWHIALPKKLINASRASSFPSCRSPYSFSLPSSSTLLLSPLLFCRALLRACTSSRRDFIFGLV